MKVLLVLAVMAVMGVTGRPQQSAQIQSQPQGGGEQSSKNPVFNIWEFAISNERYNPTRRETQSQREPCTWAIVRCCSAPTQHQLENCFANAGCPGAWFSGPCSDHYKSVVRNVVQESFAGGF